MLKDTDNFKRKYVSYSAIILIALLFLAKIHLEFLQWLDNGISGLVQAGMFDGMTSLMKLVTDIAEPKLDLIYGIFISAFLWFVVKRRVDALWSLTTIFSGAIILEILKQVVQRSRPEFNQIIPETGYSMPSGHTFQFFIILSFLYLFFVSPIKSSLVRKILLYLLLFIEFLVVYSRIYLGAHYPSDTIAAVCLGIVWMWLSIVIYHKFYNLVGSFVEPIGKHQERG